MRWVLTGGAGYIGAHVVQSLREAGHQVLVVDDLSAGSAARLPDDVDLHRLDVLDTSALTGVLRRWAPDGVVHLAARKSVPESVADPLLYWRSNVHGTVSLLEAVAGAGVRRLVFSSSAAVYGEPGTSTVTEDSPTLPGNPYGESKLACERLIASAGRTMGLSWTSLRYFNVAGAARPELACTTSASLVPVVLRRLRDGLAPQIFGDDHPTPDGTCIRDYVHVVDLAEAHRAAAEHLDATSGASCYNVGRGVGLSVREVVDVAVQVTGVALGADVLPRRGGDPASVVASVDRARAALRWSARLGVREMVTSEWHGLTALA